MYGIGVPLDLAVINGDRLSNLLFTGNKDKLVDVLLAATLRALTEVQ